VYPPMSSKPRTHVKRPFHTDRVILLLHQWAGPKKLFVPKKIRTLDLMRLPQKPRPPLPLEPKVSRLTKVHPHNQNKITTNSKKSQIIAVSKLSIHGNLIFYWNMNKIMGFDGNNDQLSYYITSTR